MDSSSPHDPATPGDGQWRVTRRATPLAITDRDLVVLFPSNPVTSIGPILAVRGVRETLMARRDTVSDARLSASYNAAAMAFGIHRSRSVRLAAPLSTARGMPSGRSPAPSMSRVTASGSGRGSKLGF
ncbi:MAG: 2-phospho-L-lactate transferase CofD family protein [Acidimicrobiales bacterium]